MTIERTVKIPENRRISLDVPQELPTGNAEIVVRAPVTAVPPDDFDEYFGCFKGHELWSEGGVRAVRKLRDEWQRSF